MRRLFWLALGVTLGVLIVRKLTRAAEKFTATGIGRGIGDGLSALAESIGEFSGDVRAAMRDRESELRAATGLDGTAGKATDR